MKKNQNFSMARFARYSVSELAANKRSLLLTLLCVVCGVFMIYLITMMRYLYMGEVSPVYIIFPRALSIAVIALFAVVYISRSFKAYHNSKSAPFAMLIPASKGEKFTYQFLLNVILLPVVMLLAFWFVDSLFKELYGFDLTLYSEVMMPLWGINSAQVLLKISCAFLFFLGAILFRRRQLIYTILSIVAINFLISILEIGLIGYTGQVGSNGLLENVNYVYIPIVFIIASMWFAWYKFKKLQIR